MRALHLTFSAHGGAGIAAARTVRALREYGIDADFWTSDGSSLGPALRSGRWTLGRVLLDRFPLGFYRRKNFFSTWSNNWQPSRLATRVNRAKPDIVHLHWVGGGFMALRDILNFQAPVVWTLHDTWALTGGCHYPNDCRNYIAECGRCPQLGSRAQRDLSWYNLRRKLELLDYVAAFVAPSEWLAKLAIQSRAITSKHIHVVPNGLDGTRFSLGDQAESRRALGLPEDALVMLAGASDLAERRKGGHLLPEAMRRIVAESPRRCVLVLFGANGDVNREWSCTVRWLGTLRQEQVVQVYRAADVLLVPSLQDNSPNIAVEAQACGCPVVGFDSGGLREIIEPMQTGWLAPRATADGLADAVQAWLSTVNERTELTAKIRQRFERKFAFPIHAQRLTSVYTQVLRDRVN